MDSEHKFIVRQKNAAYLWVIDPSTEDTYYVDRDGFKFDHQFECRGKILRIMKIDGVKFCIGRLAIGNRVAIKNGDGTPLLKEDGKQKLTYQPSTEWTWGSICYFPPSQPLQLIPGHIDLRDYCADDGTFTGKELYELVGDIVHYYNEAKYSPPVHQTQPMKMFQPTPLFTTYDYQAWKQFQAFMHWQQMNMPSYQ